MAKLTYGPAEYSGGSSFGGSGTFGSGRKKRQTVYDDDGELVGYEDVKKSPGALAGSGHTGDIRGGIGSPRGATFRHNAPSTSTGTGTLADWQARGSAMGRSTTTQPARRTGGTTGTTNDIVNYAARLLQTQTKDENEAKQRALEAYNRITGAIGELDTGAGIQAYERLAELAAEIDANPGMSDEEITLLYRQISEEEIAPRFRELRSQTAQVGGPGVRQRLGDIALQEVREQVKTMRGLKTEQRGTERQGRLEAIDAYGKAAEGLLGVKRDKVNAMLSLESITDRTVEDRVSSVIEALAAEDPALALRAINQGSRTSGFGIERPSPGGLLTTRSSTLGAGLGRRTKLPTTGRPSPYMK